MEKSQNQKKAIYEIQTAAGKLNVEINSFPRYKFITVAYASLLRLDGSMCLAHATPYEQKPSVISLSGEIGPGERLSRELCQLISMPVVLVLAVELNKEGEQQLAKAIYKICTS